MVDNLKQQFIQAVNIGDQLSFGWYANYGIQKGINKNHLNLLISYFRTLDINKVNIHIAMTYGFTVLMDEKGILLKIINPL